METKLDSINPISMIDIPLSIGEARIRNTGDVEDPAIGMIALPDDVLSRNQLRTVNLAVAMPGFVAPTLLTSLARSKCLSYAKSTALQSNPEIKGDLDGKMTIPPQLSPKQPDEKAPSVSVRYAWRNNPKGDFAGAKYFDENKRSPNDASAFSFVKNYNEVADLVNFTIGTVTTILQTFANGGAKALLAQVVEIEKQIRFITEGKEGFSRLRSDEIFIVDLARDSTVTINHTEEFELFAKDFAQCSFESSVDINSSDIPELKIENKLEQPDRGEMTADKSPSVTRTVQKELEAGQYRVRIRHDLKAGPTGILSEADKKTLIATKDKAIKLVREVANIASQAVSELIRDQAISEQTKQKLSGLPGSLAGLAIDALKALFMIVFNILTDSLASARLFETNLVLLCPAVEVDGEK